MRPAHTHLEEAKPPGLDLSHTTPAKAGGDDSQQEPVFLGRHKDTQWHRCRRRKAKRDSSLRRFYTIDAKNTSDECNLNSSQLTLEPLRGAVQTRCTQKARIGESP